MTRMTLEQLRTIKEFTIQNEFGKIHFLTPPGKPGLDLTQVNLARDFIIKQRKVEVYENLPVGVQKPAHNNKLNVPSIITLFKMEPRGNKSTDQFEENLRNSIKQNNIKNKEGDDEAEFIS